MAYEHPPLPDDRYHRHPHLTTLAFGLAAGAFIAGLLMLAGPSLAAFLFITVAAGLVFAAVAELVSLLMGVPVVPHVLTGEGLGDPRWYGAEAGGGAWIGGSSDCGGGGGDGGGGG